MRVVLQRVTHASVAVDGRVIAEIRDGVILLVGIGPQDSEAEAGYLAEKIANLRIFADEQGKINRSLLETAGEAIVVSQFTLYADTRKGRRPSFTDAALAGGSPPLVERFASSYASRECLPKPAPLAPTCWSRSPTMDQSPCGSNAEVDLTVQLSEK